LDADNDVTPQPIFFSGLSCVCVGETETADQTKIAKKNLTNIFIMDFPSPIWAGHTVPILVKKTIFFLAAAGK